MVYPTEVVKRLANTDSEKASAGDGAFSKQNQSATDLRAVETPLKAAFRFEPKPWTTAKMPNRNARNDEAVFTRGGAG